MIELPWQERTVPHFVLEINRQCNISCRGCYKRRDGTVRGVEEIEADLAAAMRVRRIHTVSIAGGEPTLHPELGDIVRRVARRGLKTALITNGLALDAAMLADLKRAGLAIVMLHVDEGQDRPDLPETSARAVNALRAKLAAAVRAHGIDAGLMATIHPEHLDRLAGTVELVLDSPDIHFLFTTHYSDILAAPGGACPRARTDNRDTLRVLREQLGLEPFAGLSAADGGPPPWLTYFVPVVLGDGPPRRFPMTGGRADRLLMRLLKAASGRYIYYCPSRPAMVAAHMLLHSGLRGRLGACLRFLAGSGRNGAALAGKRLVFDSGPAPDQAGRLATCGLCPNATVRDGRLVPICTADAEGPR